MRASAIVEMAGTGTAAGRGVDDIAADGGAIFTDLRAKFTDGMTACASSG